IVVCGPGPIRRYRGRRGAVRRGLGPGGRGVVGRGQRGLGLKLPQGAAMKKLLIAVVGVVLVSAIAATVWLWPNGNGHKVLRLPGTVEVQEVLLGSKVGGRVAEVPVREGQGVEAGTLLVRFDIPELLAQRDAARQRLAAAEADLLKANQGPREEEIAEARAQADAARAKYEMMMDGFREEEKRQAKSELDAALAD